MKKRPLLAPLLIVLLGAGGSYAWVKQQEQAFEKKRLFTERQLVVLEEDNTRLRAELTKRLKAQRLAEMVQQRTAIEKRTASLRGLDFLAPVTYETLSRDDLKGKLIHLFDKEYTDEQFEAMRLGYVAMGLIPEETQLKEIILDLLSEQIAAFYDQHAHELFMFEDASLDSAQDRVILSHELVHALQDQHFKLSELPIEIKDDDDRVLAATALIEGDATVLMQHFFISEASAKGVGQFLSAALKQKYEQLAKAPAYLRETLLFRYNKGAEFCNALVMNGTSIDSAGQGQFAALTQAYKRLPTSSTHILHPEKYIAGEQPLPIRWEKSAFRGEKPTFGNVVGEFGTSILLAEWGIPKARAVAAATGWRGDRYLYFHGSEATIWKTAWESPAKAKAFAQALEEMLAKRYKATMLPGEKEGQRFADPNTTLRGLAIMHPTETEVLLVNTAQAPLVQPLLEQFGQ